MKRKLKLTNLTISSFITEAADLGSLKGGSHGTVIFTEANCQVNPSIPVLYCAETRTNGHNCPCDITTTLLINY